MARQKRHPERPLATPPGQRSERLVLSVTALLCGAVVMVVELLAARFLAPLFGTCIVVWTAVIAVALLALAAGYTLGGRVADRWPQAGTLFGVVLLAALTLAVSGLIRRDVLQAASGLGLRGGSLVAAAVLFGPTLLLLGMVSPLVVRLYTRGLEHLGQEVGRLYALSTAGSFAGTVLSGFWLIPWLGLSRLLACCAGLLAVLAAGGFLAHRRAGAAGLAVATLALAALLGWQGGRHAVTQGSGWRVLASRDGLYGQLKIAESDAGERRLLIDGVNQGAVNWPAGTPASRYVHAIDTLITAAAPEASTVLVVGLGAGLMPTLLHEHGRRVEVVEIDPMVAALQQEFLQRGPRPYPVHFADARRFVNTCDRAFDAIVLDAFAGDAVPGHLLSREAFSEFAAHLTPGGAVVLNLVTVIGGGHTEALASVVQTMRTVFPQVRAFCCSRLDDPPDAVNVLILALPDDRAVDAAGEGRLATGANRWYVQMTLANELTLPATAGAVLSDDHNPIDIMLTRSATAWRQAIIGTENLDMLLR